MKKEEKELVQKNICMVHCKTKICGNPCGYAQAFISGMNIKNGWHNLINNPDDLPSEREKFTRFYIIMKEGADRAAYFKDGKFINIIDNCAIRTQRIIAWCEMPNFYIT